MFLELVGKNAFTNMITDSCSNHGTAVEGEWLTEECAQRYNGELYASIRLLSSTIASEESFVTCDLFHSLYYLENCNR